MVLLLHVLLYSTGHYDLVKIAIIIDQTVIIALLPTLPVFG